MLKMNSKKINQFVLHYKIPVNSDIFYYISLLIIAIITFYPLFGTGIGSADDMANYTNTRFGKEFLSSKWAAEMSGRFYYVVFGLVHNLPYEIDDQFVTKLFQVVPFCLCLFLFYRVVFILTDSKEISNLVILLFFVVAQFSPHTSLFFTYPFYFTFSFSLILSSYLLLYHFQKTKKWRYLIFSAFLFGFGLLFYEVFILFFGFAALSIIYNNFCEGKRGFRLIWQMILQMLPFVLVVIGYGLAYILYGHYHPSTYGGTTMSGGEVTFNSFFKVLWNLSYSAFPLTEYDSDLKQDFFRYKSELVDGYRNVVPYLFYHARVEWIVKSILVFILSYYTLIRIPKIPYVALLIGILISLLIIFIPHVPLALTEKYTFFAINGGMRGYVTTFFSLFGVILFLAMLNSLLLNFTNTFTLFRHGSALVISAGLVMCAFLTDFSNYYVARDVQQANLRLRTVDEMIKSDAFKNIPPYSNIYSSMLWNNTNYMAGGITEQGFQWTYYILCKSGINHPMFRDEKEFLKITKNSALPGYRIIYHQALKSDNTLLILAQLAIPGANDTMVSHVSDKVLVVYYSKCKYFSVSFKRLDVGATEKSRIKINHINDEIDQGNYVEFNIYNTKLYQPATIFTIETPAIDLRSIRISDLVSSESKVFYL